MNKAVDITNAINRCPLCKCAAHYTHYDQYDGYYGSDIGEHTIKCSNCGIQITTSSKLDTLIKWNNLSAKKVTLIIDPDKQVINAVPYEYTKEYEE